ncbi:MAG: excinuclease ABC subunit UvrC, partial [Clostridiales bacterium]|nr:excinuclease ABC subunit UvrC [Clostridiales bacterium]
MFDIQEELKKLPQKPGVYIMKDERENIIYIGKAISLKSRVRQYFQASANHSPKTQNLVVRIRSFEYIVTDNELEALILECNLIKQHRPKYNILLKDDKAYPYIKITVNESYPRVFKSRSTEKDKAKYLGPYKSAYAIAETIDLIHKIWPLRRCRKNIPQNGGDERPCLNYHIGQCKAPCKSLISYDDYHSMVAEVLDFLGGRQKNILKDLENKMLEASEEMAFERAAEIRDKIAAVRNLEEKQKLDSIAGDDQDVIALARANDEALIQAFFIRAGKMTGREHFMLSGVESLSRGAILSEFVTQYYSGTPFIPKEIILETDIEDKAVITEWLSTQKEQKVMLTVPQKGEKLRLVELAGKNALITFEQFGEQIKREHKRTQGALTEIQAA